MLANKAQDLQGDSREATLQETELATLTPHLKINLLSVDTCVSVAPVVSNRKVPIPAFN